MKKVAENKALETEIEVAILRIDPRQRDEVLNDAQNRVARSTT
jgi:hypothetical protein